MAHIVAITHKHDRLRQFSLRALGFRGRYLLYDILQELRRRGHTVTVQHGITDRLPPGDLAILHVDATITPKEYVDFAAQYPDCLNLAVTDISKRRISGAVLQTGEAWDGRVIVKSNANFGGRAEVRLNRHSVRNGEPEPFPNARVVEDYRIFERPEDVPSASFDDPMLVVERFIPEPDPAGYALRFWVFCEDQERCNRYVSASPLLKSASVTSWHPVEVPDDLRRMRQHLGFDYGKFDFVMHSGKPILLDANKTIGRPRHVDKSYALEIARFASGIETRLSNPASR
jgi:hypothetical protein